MEMQSIVGPKKQAQAGGSAVLTPAPANFQDVLGVSSEGDLCSLSLSTPNVLNHKMLVIYLKEILSEDVCEVF